MTYLTSTKSILTFCMILSTSTVFASGGYSGGGSSYGSGNYGTSQSEKRVDQAYENGKAIYKGRVNGQALKYCINDGSKSVAVKRSSVRQLKGASYADLGQRLHNCDDPKQTISSILNNGQLNSVAYYLSKRYRLNLTRS